MNNVQHNIKETQSLLNEIHLHVMAFDFEEDTHFYYVYFLQPVDGIGGIRISKEIGKIKALKKLLTKLEHFYKRDNPVLYPNYFEEEK